MKKDPRVDAYIAEAAEFARPILKHLRQVIHQGCPDGIETIKWSCPFIEFHGIFCGFAAFKAHCSFFFWRDIDVDHLIRRTNTAAGGMGEFGRIASLADLPGDKILLACVRGAVEQRLSPKSKVKRQRKPGKEVAVPPELARALARNPKAAATFKNFAPSHRREYCDWISEAKRPETREQRLATTIDWLMEGKPRNWKYLAERAGKKSAKA